MFYWPWSVDFIAISLAFQSPGRAEPSAAGLATCDGLPARPVECSAWITPYAHARQHNARRPVDSME